MNRYLLTVVLLDRQTGAQQVAAEEGSRRYLNHNTCLAIFGSNGCCGVFILHDNGS